jgi:hypothetical protein
VVIPTKSWRKTTYTYLDVIDHTTILTLDHQTLFYAFFLHLNLVASDGLTISDNWILLYIVRSDCSHIANRICHVVLDWLLWHFCRSASIGYQMNIPIVVISCTNLVGYFESPLLFQWSSRYRGNVSDRTVPFNCVNSALHCSNFACLIDAL